MKNSDKNKAKEPFNAEQTPAPPQTMNPVDRKKNSSTAGESRNRSEEEKKESPPDTGRRLGESPLEIDDETTI